MQPRSLSSFTAFALVCGLAVACGGEGGTSTESTGETTGGATTGTPEPTTTGSTGSTGDTPTTEPATTTGDSDSGTGSTGATTLESTGAVDTTTFGSTGDSTGASTGVDTTTGASTGGASTGGESTGGGDPVSFAECQDGMAASCPAMDAACLVVDGPGGFWPEGSFFVQWTYCTRECETDADCVSGLEGGSAKPVCLPKGANDIKVCVLDCSFGKTCPDGLECSYDDACGTKHCDCEGEGCQDDLCK